MIFVSHRETDGALAKALVEFLRASLDLPAAKVRCTSVPGFQLPFGKTIAGQLKDDIDASNAVFVLITRESLQSHWVLFELGAAWALGKVIVPILGPGLSPTDLPGPLSEYPVVNSDNADAAARLRDAVSQVAKGLALTEKGGGEAQSGLESFMRTLREWASTTPPPIACAVAFQLSWLLTRLVSKIERYPAAVEAQVESHCDELGLRLPPTWRESLLNDKTGEAYMDLFYKLGGQLAARRGQLVPYFEAGLNLLLEAMGKGEGPPSLEDLVSKLNLPQELRQPAEDKLAWVNRVHDYFEGFLRERDG